MVYRGPHVLVVVDCWRQDSYMTTLSLWTVVRFSSVVPRPRYITNYSTEMIFLVPSVSGMVHGPGKLTKRVWLYWECRCETPSVRMTKILLLL